MLGAVFAPFGAPLRNEDTAADRGLEKVNGQFRAMASMTTCVSIPPWKSPANDQWCAQSCDRAGLKTAHCSATICKCGGDELKTAPDGQAAQAAPAGESEQEEGRIVCERYVSTREDTPDSWCTSYCATDEGCPDDVGDVCKCGDDIQMTDEEKVEDAELKEHFKNAEHDFTTTWTEEQEAVKRRQEQEGQEGAEARDQRDRVLKQQEDLMHARRGMQQAAEAATRGAEGQSPFDVAHGGGAAPDAAVQQPQQQQSVFEKEERRAQEQALQPQDVPMHIIKERQQQQEVDSGFPMCVSISMDKTNEWCAKACSTDAGCQGDAKKACKCGDEAIENLDKASEATAAREAAAAQANAEALAKGIKDSAESAQQSAQQGGALPQPAAMPLPVDNTKYCPEMTEITADQLRCVFNMLDMGRAEMYASAATSKLGGEHGTLTTACEWAAFLGNAAIESKELTIWKEIECATQPPYCGRGPLQITGLKNYDFCAAHPACDCPDISDDVEKPATDATVGFGTAACVWAGVFGYSLSQLVDGSREGFLNTCCTIHQGHYPCLEMEQYENREQYWTKATTCLGAIERKDNGAADQGQVNTDWADTKGVGGLGWAPSDDGCNTAAGEAVCSKKKTEDSRRSK